MSATIEMKKLLDRVLGVPLVRGLAVARTLRRAGSRRAGSRRGHSSPGATLDPPPWDRSISSDAAKSTSSGATPRILLIKLWGLGNLSMILPLARAIRELYGSAEIDLLTLEANREFATACPHVDHVIGFHPGGLPGPALRLIRMAARLRKKRYDLVIDFEQFLKTTALLTWSVAPRHSIGFRTAGQARHGLYDQHVPHDDRRHMALVFADLVRAAGVDTEHVPPLFVPPPRKVGRVASLLASTVPEHAPIVVLHVGSGDHFEGRRWPAARFARVADLLVARAGARVFLTGTRAEAPLVQDCRARMKSEAIDLAGALSVHELVDLLAHAQLLISNDTAPIHLASALGIPLIGLYGPNTPRLYGPLSPRSVVFFRGLSCSPCLTNTNAKTSFCRKPVCLTSIEASEVLHAALDLLGARAARSVEHA